LNVINILSAVYRKLCNVNFPNGIKSIFINGKYYTKEEFFKAKRKSRLRNSNSKIVEI